MKRTKIFMLIVTALVLVSSCCAYADGVKLGTLSRTREAVDLVRNISRETGSLNNVIMWRLFGFGDGKVESLKYYDNLASMIMAMNAGEIDEFTAPKLVAEYIINTNPDYVICYVKSVIRCYYTFSKIPCSTCPLLPKLLRFV